MNRLLCFLLQGFCFLGASFLGAQDNQVEAETIRITREDCYKLKSYQSDGTVGYKPGVDVNGRAVVDADLNAQQFTLPETFDVPIEVDLQERYGLPARSSLHSGVMQIGTLALDQEGRAFLNGQALFNEEEAALQRACKEKLLTNQ